MPRATAGQENVKSIEQAVSYAVGHRIRIEVLAMLNVAPRSPSELARILGLPLGRVIHHTDALLESRCIEIAETTSPPSSNVTATLYRSIETIAYTDAEMEAKTPEERKEIYGVILQSSMAEALASFWAGKIAVDPRAWLAWDWFNVDVQGREEIADELEGSWQRIHAIEARAAERCEESGEERASVVVSTQGFERSRTVFPADGVRKH